MANIKSDWKEVHNFMLPTNIKNETCDYETKILKEVFELEEEFKLNENIFNIIPNKPFPLKHATNIKE